MWKFSVQVLIVILIGFWVWLSSCTSQVEVHSTPLVISERTFQTTRESKIVGSEEYLWQPSLSNMGSNQYLEYFQAFDDNTIYILGDGGYLFRRTGNGKNWESTKIEIPQNSFISSIHFFDSSYGVLSLISTPKDVLDVDNFYSWILITNDKGKTWHKQFEIKAAEIRKITFDKEKNVWAVGRKMVREEVLTNQPLVIIGDSTGKWSEMAVSEMIKGSVENIFLNQDKKLLISNYGQIFELNNEMKWKKVDGIESIKPPQIGISTIRMTDDKKVYLIGATGGREGRWTSFFSNDLISGRWRHYKLQDIFIQDAIFLSPEEIIACGSFVNINSSGSNGMSQGVILHSFDGGINWSISYKTSKTRAFSRLWSDSKNNVFAIGDQGIVLQLEKNNSNQTKN